MGPIGTAGIVENLELVEREVTPAAARMEYFDLLRVLSCVCVIALHLSSEGVARDFAAPARWWSANLLNGAMLFAVPVFVMLSGALLLGGRSGDSILGFYRRRLPKIVIPLAAWSLIYRMVNFPHELTLRGVFANLFSAETTSVHLWFLHMLVPLYLAAPFLKIIIENTGTRTQALFVGICFFITSLLPLISNLTGIGFTVGNPVWNSIFTQYAGYFVLGWLIHRRLEMGEKKQLAVGLALAGAGYLIAVGGTYGMFLKQAVYNDTFHSYGSFNVWMMAAGVFMLARSCNRSLRGGWLAGALARISPAAYGIYLSHVLVWILFMGWGKHIPGFPFFPKEFALPVIGIPVNTISIGLVSLGLTLGLRKIKWVRAIVP